jgi:hypothetical protein
VLLKPRVFLHLLYNRAHEPFFAETAAAASSAPAAAMPQVAPSKAAPTFVAQASQDGLDAARRSDLYRVGAIAVVAETIIRLCRYAPTIQLNISPMTVLIVLLSAAAEIGAQLLTSSILALLILYIRGWWWSEKSTDLTDGRRIHFRYTSRRPVAEPYRHCADFRER